MENLVEGEWKQFTFKRIESTDFPVVLHHLRNNFYVDEAIYKIVGNSDAKNRDLDTFVTGILNRNDDLSFIVTDTENGKIAGVCINYRNKKDSNISAAFKFESVERAIILNFVVATNKAGDIFEKYGVDEYADLYVASVDREYRSQGLCTEMYRRTLLLLRSLKFPAVKSIFSSPYTRQIARKHGFEELARRYYREMQDLNGGYLCPNAGDDEFCSVMALKL